MKLDLLKSVIRILPGTNGLALELLVSNSIGIP